MDEYDAMKAQKDATLAKQAGKPDFAVLRAVRNNGIRKMIADVAAEHGIDPSKIGHSFDFDACYCACASGGPCEHHFQGWRPIADEDGSERGGETFCSRCGMGATSHSLHSGM